MKTQGSKKIKSDSGGNYSPTIGGNKPQFNKAAALPKNWNKPFWQRFKEWLK